MAELRSWEEARGNSPSVRHLSFSYQFTPSVSLTPTDAAPCQEEVTSTTRLAPHGRLERHRAIPVLFESPPWPPLPMEADLQHVPTAARAKQSREPPMLPLARHVHCPRVERVRQLLHMDGVEWAGEPAAECLPESSQPGHAAVAAGTSLGSGAPSSGVVSTRPMCRSSTRHGTPSPAVISRAWVRLNVWTANSLFPSSRKECSRASSSLTATLAERSVVW